jgi:hypothetical protein
MISTLPLRIPRTTQPLTLNGDHSVLFVEDCHAYLDAITPVRASEPNELAAQSFRNESGGDHVRPPSKLL